MSYNITGWKIKKLHLALPLSFDFRQWVKSQPASIGKRWCLEDEDDIPCVQVNIAAQTWKLPILNADLSGHIEKDQLILTEIDGWTNDFSGTLYDDILLPLFSEFKGNMKALVIWKGGDTVKLLTITDGKIEAVDWDEE